MELREMSEACENQEKDLTLNTDTANSPETSGTEAAETVVTENNSGEDNSAPIVNNTQAPEDNPAGKQVATDYSALDKQGLVAALEAQLQKPIESIRDDVNLIKVAFYSLRNAELAAEKEEFVANGNEETAFAPKSDPDEEKFKELGSNLETASLLDFMSVYQVNMMNPKVLLGMFIGSMMSFLFCGLTMNAVGRAANQMVEEVRRQFRENLGIMEGKSDPDYARCVAISTKAAQKEMLFPALLAVAAPIVTGIFFGVAGVLGLLGGALASGFVLAVFMANSGGAWDNAKKYIEQGNFGGKGSTAHKAAVIGDTVGDPFKDTSGPSLNILIKLMSMVAIVMAGFTVSYSIF